MGVEPTNQQTSSSDDGHCTRTRNTPENDSLQLFRELMLVADALRLGGAILSQYPDMLSPQLIGRLLPEMDANPHVMSLLHQCDAEGIQHCGIVPTYHCSHTPGGPLKVWVFVKGTI
ncbi:NACHT and WD repeat domain-containing protein 2 [Chionoecetes opilio]|uniref:NACHT and WD repeat domain-containing protein 2 n=1 Tax=Chionoecetes opilio TaxID=41210 RepID=A0A8J5CXJ0_CHIOP|nr:NACHT and WD repeat domain-containing protein 2 [Chionoecetes opilio]